jgi:GAF domain-containing protein
MPDFDAQAGRTMPPSPATSSAESGADDEHLQVGLAGLAGLVSGSLEVEVLLAQVAEFATSAIPGADGAGVTLLRPVGEAGSLRIQTWAATVDFVRDLDEIQYELVHEGPCITCMHLRRPMVSGSLGSDQRWPRFGGRAARLGVHSTLSLPLLVHDHAIGAVNSYARERDAFTEHAVQLGMQFAGPAAVAVHNALLLVSARAKAEQLQAALTSRAVIDQAIGILLSRSGGDADEAFGRLRRISQAENVKVSVIAQRLVDDAVRRAHARHAGQPAAGQESRPMP